MKKIIISLFILILLCLLTYILIKSNFDYTSNKYFKYFLIITISLIFFIILFFAKEKIQEIFLILFISILFALYSVEVSMPLFVDGLYNKYQFSKSRKKLIKNYVLIDELNISFNSGFSVITGETGAGKSMVLVHLGAQALLDQ